MEDLNLAPAPTAEDIAKVYSSSLDSVSLVNALVAKGSLSEEELSDLRRNVKHLEYVMERTYWTNEDFSSHESAIAAGNAVL